MNKKKIICISLLICIIASSGNQIVDANIISKTSQKNCDLKDCNDDITLRVHVTDENGEDISQASVHVDWRYGHDHSFTNSKGVAEFSIAPATNAIINVRKGLQFNTTLVELKEDNIPLTVSISLNILSIGLLKNNKNDMIGTLEVEGKLTTVNTYFLDSEILPGKTVIIGISRPGSYGWYPYPAQGWIHIKGGNTDVNLTGELLGTIRNTLPQEDGIIYWTGMDGFRGIKQDDGEKYTRFSGSVRRISINYETFSPKSKISKSKILQELNRKLVNRVTQNLENDGGNNLIIEGETTFTYFRESKLENGENIAFGFQTAGGGGYPTGQKSEGWIKITEAGETTDLNGIISGTLYGTWPWEEYEGRRRSFYVGIAGFKGTKIKLDEGTYTYYFSGTAQLISINGEEFGKSNQMEKANIQ